MQFNDWFSLLKSINFWTSVACAFAILIGLILSWYFVGYFVIALKKHKKFKKGKKKFKFAILIPARNEDKVIKNCLDSLKNQTYPKKYFDVYVIVESNDDPTVKITKSYGYNIVIRKNLVHRRTKGYALDECYQYLKENNLEYDAFMVFDADNILSSNYIELMNDCKNEGYQVGVGYRNYTNTTENWATISSALLFSFMSTFMSPAKSLMFDKAVITGTGYYVDREIIDYHGEWIFNGMTEDVEFATYCYNHNIKMHYYDLAIFYDEQATSMKVIHKQHIRWTWGFFSIRKIFKGKDPNYNAKSNAIRNIGIFENSFCIFPLVAVLIFLLIATIITGATFISSIVLASFDFSYWNEVWYTFFSYFIVWFGIVYATFFFSALLVIIVDNKRLKLKGKDILKGCFLSIFYLTDFVFAFFDGLFHKKKRTNWDAIKHEGVVLNTNAKESKNGKKKR